MYSVRVELCCKKGASIITRENVTYTSSTPYDGNVFTSKIGEMM